MTTPLFVLDSKADCHRVDMARSIGVTELDPDLFAVIAVFPVVHLGNDLVNQFTARLYHGTRDECEDFHAQVIDGLRERGLLLSITPPTPTSAGTTVADVAANLERVGRNSD